MIYAYKTTDGSAKIYNGNRADVERLAVPGSIKEIDRCPIRGEEILDPVTLTIVPDPDKARREKLAALSATDAAVIRGVDDLCALLVAKGVIRADDLAADLKAKLDARAALRAELAAVAAK